MSRMACSGTVDRDCMAAGKPVGDVVLRTGSGRIVRSSALAVQIRELGSAGYPDGIDAAGSAGSPFGFCGETSPASSRQSLALCFDLPEVRRRPVALVEAHRELENPLGGLRRRKYVVGAVFVHLVGFWTASRSIGRLCRRSCRWSGSPSPSCLAYADDGTRACESGRSCTDAKSSTGSTWRRARSSASPVQDVSGGDTTGKGKEKSGVRYVKRNAIAGDRFDSLGGAASASRVVEAGDRGPPSAWHHRGSARGPIRAGSGTLAPVRGPAAVRPVTGSDPDGARRLRGGGRHQRLFGAVAADRRAGAGGGQRRPGSAFTMARMPSPSTSSTAAGTRRIADRAHRVGVNGGPRPAAVEAARPTPEPLWPLEEYGAVAGRSF